ncbi:alpha/beta-hydrolase [Leucogyrophana mollusca]|uniref:Alpha/beta-hydrolase n=1 Tax=Leucogyrophana mollusca TaxID=85980 RepID=A0ACB8BWW6_9AGAM|nr:alpha/beta-hydrolase [Leucogyrophana mollusca]
MLAFAVLVAFSFRQAWAAPSAASVGSDLTFFFQNDLNWPAAQDHNGTILLSKPSMNTEALASCGQLYETLLPTNGTYFQSDITDLLRYLAFEGAAPSQQYWVDSSSATECQAISSEGIQTVNCDEQLPAFCSQSAPYRPNTDTDMSTQYQVQVSSGNLTVLGTRDHLSFRFIGIPYADPYERFTYSSVYSSAGDISALAYGSPCVQIGYGSEDCLFLNIQTPYLPASSATSKTLKPVMFWIHGGAYTSGEGSDGIFDGGNAASRSDVVVVTINYRLSTLGFLALEDGVTNGNFGIADQITALRWVQEHIADFGGDPSRVTIFGQSAGAGSVRALLAAPPAFGLFAGAIAQSNLDGFGYADTYSNYYTIEQEVYVAADPLIEYVNCTDSADVLACLRSVSAVTLVNAPTAPRYVVVDGTYITTNQLELNGTGPTAKAHVIFGWMRDDGTDFAGSYPTMETTLAESIMGIGLNETYTDAIIASGLFPVPAGNNYTLDTFNVTSRVATDGEFRCLDQATVVAAAKHELFESIYTYQFDKSYMGYEPIPGICDPPATEEYPYGDPSLPYFQCHSGELYFTFGTLGQSALPFRDWNDLYFSQYAVDAWTSFARTYDPNPSFAYLAARGYTNTTEALLKYGLWEEVTTTSATPLRIMDVPLLNSAYLEQEQCDLLGYPLNYYG